MYKQKLLIITKYIIVSSNSFRIPFYRNFEKFELIRTSSKSFILSYYLIFRSYLCKNLNFGIFEKFEIPQNVKKLMFYVFLLHITTNCF